ncbi:unnamed protein product [Rotaria socialis]
MWKTRFEVTTSSGESLNHHRTFTTPSTTMHHYCSWSLPKLAHVRDESPYGLIRSFSSSSIPNLEILTEEDENMSCSNLTYHDQTSLVSKKLRKQNSKQAFIRQQLVLPTIIESNDHDAISDSQSYNDDEDITVNELINDRHNEYIFKSTPKDSFGATNTNYNLVIQNDIERKEETINTTINHDTAELTFDTQIHEILQRKTSKLNKSLSSSADVDKNKIFIPTTFKDISAFFETKSLIANKTDTSKQKKIVRAKRQLSAKSYMHTNNHNLPKIEIISLSEPESTFFRHQIKRLKKTSNCEFEPITEQQKIVKHIATRQLISFDKSIKKIEHENQAKQLPILMNNKLSMNSLINQCFFVLFLTITILLYLYFSNLTNNSKYTHVSNPIVHLQNYPFKFSPRQSQKSIESINKNVISRYGQMVRNFFFSIDKYEYKNNIFYVITSTYEHIYDYFVHLFM